MATCAPASAKACAMIRPKPFAPPVIKALRPSSLNKSKIFFCVPSGNCMKLSLLILLFRALVVARYDGLASGKLRGGE
jgi:hypothetical protein